MCYLISKRCTPSWCLSEIQERERERNDREKCGSSEDSWATCSHLRSPVVFLSGKYLRASKTGRERCGLWDVQRSVASICQREGERGCPGAPTFTVRSTHAAAVAISHSAVPRRLAFPAFFFFSSSLQVSALYAYMCVFVCFYMWGKVLRWKANS